MKHRPQFMLAGALLIAVMALARLNQRSRSDSAGGNRGASCPLHSLPEGWLPGPVTNGTTSNTNPLAGTNQFF